MSSTDQGAYVIREIPEGAPFQSDADALALQGLVLRGAAKQLWSCRDQEAMIAGPAETGKTIGCLAKVNALLWKYPKCQGVMIRKSYKSIPGSCAQSFEEKILGNTLHEVVKKYGGEKPEWYDYPNGSRLWVAGMDNADKVLSSERDFIYVNQAEELQVHDWEYLITRATGRAGHMPYGQVFGDCNPSQSNHWIKQRFGPRLLVSTHKDNPNLHDEQGNILPQGHRTMAALNALTGARHARLCLGQWVGAEGLVYPEFDFTANVWRSKYTIPYCNRFLELVDFGFNHPFVWQRWAITPDGVIYVTHEIYWSYRIVEDHVNNHIMPIVKNMKNPEAIVCDHDAEDRATFEKYRRRRTTKAIKMIMPGIELVKKRIAPDEKGNVRFYYCEDAPVAVDPRLKAQYKPTNSLEEIENYEWNEDKDMPKDENNHGMDLWRYGIVYVDAPKGTFRRSPSFSFTSGWNR